jgi:hypothetical protein
VFFNLPAPAPADATSAANWRVRYFYAPGAPPVDAILGPIGTGGLAGSGRADLPFSGAVPAGASGVLVQYSGPSGGSSWHTDLPCPAFTTKTEKFVAATGKDDSDIYISGGYSPATATTPTYSADVNLGLRFQRTGISSWQVVGSMKTDNRKKADPDSFRWRVARAYEWGTALAPALNIGAGMEFDRTGEARNVVFSPRASIVPLAGAKIDNGTLIAAAALEIRGGIETGGNTNDTFRFNSVNYPGTNGLFRGVPGASLYINIFNPKLWFLKFKKIGIVSNYDVRLLALPEIFLETRVPGPNPVPEIRQQPRNHTDTGIALKLTDAVGFTVKYEYGSLPPAFVYVRNKLTLGILLQLKESRGLRP